MDLSLLLACIMSDQVPAPDVVRLCGEVPGLADALARRAASVAASNQNR